MQLHPHPTSEEAPPGPEHPAGKAPRAPLSSGKRRLLWWIGGVVVLLLLIFLPPLINANRYQREIARSMSESLGRPVHLDNVTLHLLPLPGLTLTNLVVSEDPAFGAEPTIRANTVEATLRLSSLWRRRVEFSTVRFEEPSVNLVRNAEGRWNLDNVLLHAAHVDTAPTVQRRAGPTPRFPYIEATGGRVNIKLGENKLPYALTDADFALWLPSPRVWRVRLQGQPARTDTTITDPGTLRIEGDLHREPTAAEVQVDLRASWHDAPMGQATKLLTDNDMGWRGTLNLEASLAGTLGQSHVSSRLTLGSLRRSDFAAAHPLDLQISCAAALSIETVTARSLLCTMPDDAPSPMALQAPALNLQHAEQANATLQAKDIPGHWALLWAALFSPRVPTDLDPVSTVDLQLRHVPGGELQTEPAPARTRLPPKRIADRRQHRSRGLHGRKATEASAASTPPAANEGGSWNGWAGEVDVNLPAAPGATASQPAAGKLDLPVHLVWLLERVLPPGSRGSTSTAASAGVAPASESAPRDPVFRLQPVTIHAAADASVTLTGDVSPEGYDVNVVGSASAALLLLPARYLPQLGEGLDAILPFPPTDTNAARVDFSCTHVWGSAQTCTSRRPPVTSGRPLLLVPQTAPAPAPAPATPSLLAPRSLSPLDHAPGLGGMPAPAHLPEQPGSPRL